MAIIMFFDLNTTLLITLLELGLYVKDKRLVVCYLQKYFRWTNVQFICRNYGVKQVHMLKELAEEVMEKMRYSEECGNGDDKYISWVDYLQALGSK